MTSLQLKREKSDAKLTRSMVRQVICLNWSVNYKCNCRQWFGRFLTSQVLIPLHPVHQLMLLGRYSTSMRRWPEQTTNCDRYWHGWRYNSHFGKLPLRSRAGQELEGEGAVFELRMKKFFRPPFTLWLCRWDSLGWRLRGHRSNRARHYVVEDGPMASSVYCGMAAVRV